MAGLAGKGLSTSDWPGLRAADRFGLWFPVAWLGFTAAVVIRSGHFTYDQAYFYELSLRTARSLQLPGYGPFVSGFDFSALTPGGLLYVAYAPPFFFFDDPRAGHAWICLLALAGAVLFDRAQRRLGVAPAARAGTLLLYLAAAAHARALETFWNGDLFLFLTPATLYLSARLAEEPRASAWRWAALGALGALAVQTHISGALGLAVCASIIALRAQEPPRAKDLALFCAAVLAAYLPYLYREWATGFPNAELLARAGPQGQPLLQAIGRSLAAPYIYTSHAEGPRELGRLPAADWAAQAAWLSGWLAAALAALGLLVRHPLKLQAVLTLLALPAFFAVTRRAYQHHYVATLVPFACTFAGAGLGWLLSGPRARRAVGLCACAFAVASGAALRLTQLEREVLSAPNPYAGLSVGVQLEKARQALASEPREARAGDEEAFVLAVLARRVLGQELLFQAEGTPCRVDLRLSGLGDSRSKSELEGLRPLAANSVFVCPP